MTYNLGHKFSVITRENGPECAHCGTYRWALTTEEKAGACGALSDRTCETPGCDEPLPIRTLTGKPDTFPRCGAHAA